MYFIFVIEQFVKILFQNYLTAEQKISHDAIS
jgi:hypothetical protein